MLLNFINIIGVDDPSDFPILTLFDRYRQFNVEETLVIPEEKPDVEQITSVMVEATIDNYRVIATPTGLKVIIDGTLNQKVIYTADEPTQSVHSAHFEKPFCSFIEVPLVLTLGQTVLDILQILGLTLETSIIPPPHIIIEDMSVKQLDPRTIQKCGVLFAWVAVNPLLAPFFPVTT